MTDIDEDLVKLANSLFNSEEVDDFKINLLHLFFLVLIGLSGVEPRGQLFPCCQPRKPLF